MGQGYRAGGVERDLKCAPVERGEDIGKGCQSNNPSKIHARSRQLAKLQLVAHRSTGSIHHRSHVRIKSYHKLS